MDCIFCKIIAGEIPSHRVYEDDAVIAFLDINPATRGHTLVVPRRHSNDVFDTAPDDLESAARAVQIVARKLHSVVQADGFNVLQNNGPAAGQAVAHYHVHLIPRRAGDGALRAWRPGETDHAALGALAAEVRAVEGS